MPEFINVVSKDAAGVMRAEGYFLRKKLAMLEWPYLAIGHVAVGFQCMVWRQQY